MIKVSLNFQEKQVASWVQATFLFCGAGSFTYGAYVMWKPAGYMIAGVLMFAAGLLMNKVMESK